jgi:hypothetical protein
LSNYHKGTSHHMSFWEMITKECDRYHLSRQFNKETKWLKHFKASRLSILRFTWRIYKQRGMETCCVNVWTKYTKGTRFCITLIFQKKFLSDDYAIKEQLPNEQQVACAQERTNVVNLDEFASSSQHFLVFNLLDTINASIACT